MAETKRPDSTGSEVIHSGERALGHIVAIVAGLFLMVIGVGLSVTMVLLPLGIPVGLVGLLLFVGGLFPGSLGERRKAK